MDLKIAWFTEGGWYGKIPRDHLNMRNDSAWMHLLRADHYPVFNVHEVEQEYDIGFLTVPKTNIDKLYEYPLIENMRKCCKKVVVMQEGPHWYFQDYSIEHQIWFYNILMEMDIIFGHNDIDVKYYRGLTGKRCEVMPTTMILDNVTDLNYEKENKVMIGGNFVHWYGGFDSYMIAREYGLPIYAPSMGRRVPREEELGINHFPYMNWTEWIKTLSTFKYGVHMMRTHAAGTFSLNCSFLGIPCIGYKGLDTQEKVHNMTSVELGDMEEAKKIAKRLKEDTEFYEVCSETTKRQYHKYFSEDIYVKHMGNILSDE
jgi:hypothetical protein